MAILSMKQQSTHCKECGVEFNKTNKYPKRALCLDCQKIEYKKSKERMKAKRINFHDLYAEIKIEKRKHIHAEINEQLKNTKTTEERREFLSNRFEEIQNDKLLWNYLNRDTQRRR
jgi:hypothetical protein